MDSSLKRAVIIIILVLLFCIILYFNSGITGDQVSQATVSQLVIIGAPDENPCDGLNFWKCIRTDECKWYWRARECDLRK